MREYSSQMLALSPMKLVTGCLVAAGVVSAANGAPIMTFSDGVDPVISVTDNGPGDMSPATGVIVAQANVGVWILSVSTAITEPVLGSSGNPMMDINIQADSTSAGTLQLTFSDGSFAPDSGILNSVVTGQLVKGAASTLSYNVYGDPGNVVGTKNILLASVGTVNLSALGTPHGSGSFSFGAPYSLTQVITFDAAGPAEVDADASFTVAAVPEPGILSLAALGLVVWGISTQRRGGFNHESTRIDTNRN